MQVVCHLLVMSTASTIQDRKSLDELAYQLTLPESARDKALVRNALPEYTGETFNEGIATNTFKEMYGYYRALGMSRADAAHRMGVTSTQVERMFRGHGLSYNTILGLIQSELRALAEFKENHLTALMNASGAGKWQASLAALELICSGDFRKNDSDAPPLEIAVYGTEDYQDVELPDAPN